MGSPLVSVMTPVYNGQQYLAECIQSVLRQSYSDWEYVIFNNMSTDDTRAIAEGFAARDARIRVINSSEFREIYENHNTALQALDPNSRYCKIVHADDQLYPECLERMVELAEAHPSVGVVAAFRLYGDSVDLDGIIPASRSVLPGREVLRWAMLGRAWRKWATGSPTSTLLRADLFRGIPRFYDESLWHSDTEVVFRALLHSDFGFVHQVLTYTRSHSAALTSLSNRINSFKPEEGRIVVRFAPTVLNRDEYRRRIRRWWASYGFYLTRQFLNPRRFGDREFLEFHQREIDLLLAEAPSDVELRVALSLCRALLRVLSIAPTGAARAHSTESQLSLNSG